MYCVHGVYCVVCQDERSNLFGHSSCKTSVHHAHCADHLHGRTAAARQGRLREQIMSSAASQYAVSQYASDTMEPATDTQDTMIDPRRSQEIVPGAPQPSLDDRRAYTCGRARLLDDRRA